MDAPDFRVTAFSPRASSGSTRHSTMIWLDQAGEPYDLDSHTLVVLVDAVAMVVTTLANVATVTWVFPEGTGPVPLQVVLDGIPQTAGDAFLSEVGTDEFVGDITVVVSPLSFTLHVIGGGVAQADLVALAARVSALELGDADLVSAIADLLDRVTALEALEPLLIE